MPTEIADSDGESELNSPAKEDKLVANHPPETQQSAASNDFGVHFSDFLSQEQRIHDEWHLQSPNPLQTKNLNNVEPEGVSTGIGDEPARNEHLIQHTSTTSFGGAVEFELPIVETTPTTSRKRGRTTWNDGDDASGSNHTSQKRPRVGRAQTYGSGNDRQKSSQTPASNDAFQDILQTRQGDGESGDAPGHVLFASAPAESRSIAGTDALMQPPTTASSRAIEDDESPRRRNRPRRVLSLLEESMSEAPREISTSRSSIGNYESINIDFRSIANGGEVGANPFGNLSQTSVEDEDRDAGREKTATHLGLDSLNASAGLHGNTSNRSEINDSSERWNGCNGIYGDGQYETLGRSKSRDPMLLNQNLQNGTQPLSPSTGPARNSGETVPDTYVCPAVETEERSVIRSSSDSGLVSAKLGAKKRGRKPKSQRLLSELPRHIPEDPGLPDELTVGPPKEYCPAGSSHSRAANSEMAPKPALPDPAIKNPEVKEDDQASPVKPPTSELNLSDEAFIGLPKENYKPRPSRSRSKKTVVGDEEITQPEAIEDVGEVLTSTVVPDAAESTPAMKPKKPAKKTKVKRAKTSAAALLKKSQAMLSEGEDDVLWLETKPSEVKLDLPPDIKRQVDLERKEIPAAYPGNGRTMAAENGAATDEKGEEAALPDEDTNAVSQTVDVLRASAAIDDAEYEPKRKTDTLHITVDIPPQPSSTAKVEPKKRGRKKKSAEILNTEEVDLEGPHESFKIVAETNMGGLSEKANDGAPQPQTKKRGRKKDVAKDSIEQEDTNDNTEPDSDPSPAEPSRNGNRSALAEKDPNRLGLHSNIENSEQPASVSRNDTSSPQKESRDVSAVMHLETPHKQASKEDEPAKGPTKHSPINPSGGKAVYRVGLSKRAAIPRLLKIVRKDVGKMAEKEKPKRRLESHAPVEDDD